MHRDNRSGVNGGDRRVSRTLTFWLSARDRETQQSTLYRATATGWATRHPHSNFVQPLMNVRAR
eukprot:776587-Prymnesium_polylepis.3